VPAIPLIWSQLPLHVIDFEGSSKTGVIESGVVTLQGGEIVSARSRLHTPRLPVPAVDTQCHGLSDHNFKETSPFEADWDFWLNLRAGGLFIAHHAAVESRLLRDTWPRPAAVPAFISEEMVADWGPWIDSCRLARAWMPSLGEYKLSILIQRLKLSDRLNQWAERYCPSDRRRFHCALYDALASALIIRALCSLEGRTHLPLAQLIKDSLSAPASEDFMQGELEL
jgi:DNA polymerase-3 subunit epsilon